MSFLLIVDVQNDFCPGGSLAVPDGDKVVPVINGLRHSFESVALTQDWHPANHSSFASNHAGRQPGDRIQLGTHTQILWPPHCIQGSAGAQFHPELVIQPTDLIFKKGTDPGIDSYSAFYDNAHLKSTGLSEKLRELGVRDLAICGLALDYCVKFSALDALLEGFEVTLIPEACRAVNLAKDDGERALQDLRNAGVKLARLTSAGLIRA